jgi:hypothetical protein
LECLELPSRSISELSIKSKIESLSQREAIRK